MTTITIDSLYFENDDDCLASAEAAAKSAAGELDGWDLSPRWADDERDEILLDVPAEDAESIVASDSRFSVQ